MRVVPVVDASRAAHPAHHGLGRPVPPAEAALWFTLALVYDRAGPRAGDRLFVALVLIALAILLRRPIWRVVRKMWVKHRFRRAVVDAKLITERNRIPAAYKMTEAQQATASSSVSPLA